MRNHLNLDPSEGRVRIVDFKVGDHDSRVNKTHELDPVRSVWME